MSSISRKEIGVEYLGPNATLKPVATSRNSANVPAELLEALRSGDHDAFDRVFIIYFDKIKYFIHLLIRSRHEAEELAQEIFVNLWTTHDRIDPSRNFNAYLYRMARNAVYNHVRNNAVRNGRVSDLWEVDPAGTTDSEEIIIAKETQLLIDIAVNRMPRQRKTIFQMSRYENLDNTEIAERLNISRNAVEKQLRLALADIRDIITLFIILFIPMK